MHTYQGDATGLPVHAAGQFPYVCGNNALMTISTTATKKTLPAAAVLEGLVFDSRSAGFGIEIVLTNVLAFYVHVFDPEAPLSISASGNDVVSPLE